MKPELPLVPPESILLQLRSGLAQYQQHLGRRPTVFGRRRYGLSPILPQILRQFGFRGAVHVTLDDGRFPQGDGAKTSWEGLSGTSIDTLARVPIDANDPVSFAGLAEKVGHAMDHDHVATVGFAHWPARTSPFYDDLRRAMSYAAVLGKFMTLDHYFANTDAPGMFSRLHARPVSCALFGASRQERAARSALALGFVTWPIAARPMFANRWRH